MALIVDGGSAPANLLDALAVELRARENGCEWLPPAEVDASAGDGESGDRLAPGEPRW